MIIDRIAADHRIAVKKKFCDALVGELSIGGEEVLLAKPQTFMNRSGAAVQRLLRELRMPAEDLVVVYDELDLPFGRIRIRSRGSAAGHRGVASIIESLDEAPFYRVRVGIGRPGEGSNATDFVLERFTTEELEQLGAVVARASEAVVCLLRDGGRRAMEQFNRVA
jgi:PTH1 family peptidyl-tRNA hydrolase